MMATSTPSKGGLATSYAPFTPPSSSSPSFLSPPHPLTGIPFDANHPIIRGVGGGGGGLGGGNPAGAPALSAAHLQYITAAANGVAAAAAAAASHPSAPQHLASQHPFLTPPGLAAQIYGAAAAAAAAAAASGRGTANNSPPGTANQGNSTEKGLATPVEIGSGSLSSGAALIGAGPALSGGTGVLTNGISLPVHAKSPEDVVVERS